MFLKVKIPFLSLLLSLSLTQMLTADIQTNDLLKHIQTYAGIEEYELTSNGLKVLLYPNETMPIATVMLTYKVGSRNETQGVTGATHILEHMMFKGTNKFPLKDQKTTQAKWNGSELGQMQRHQTTEPTITPPCQKNMCL